MINKTKKFVYFFKKYNQTFIEKKSSEKKALIIDRGIGESAIMNIGLANILNKRYLMNIFLLQSNERNITSEIYKIMNINNCFNINIKKNLFNFGIIIPAVLIFLISIIKILFLRKSWFIKKFKLEGIYFGDIIYDTFIRYDNDFLKESLINKKFLKLLFISIYKILIIENVLKKNKFNCIIASTHTYASDSAFAIRLALKKKITVLYVISSRLRIFRNLSQSYIQDLVYDRKQFIHKFEKNFKNWKKQIQLYLFFREKGKLKRNTAIDAYKNKIDISKKKFYKNLNIRSSNYKKIILFAPHCFSDANHSRGNLVFDSYYDQFTKSIDYFKKKKNILFLVKIHPSSFRYNEQNIIKQYFKKVAEKNIILCPESLKVTSLIKFSDLVITGRGTIGLEAAVTGKKPLMAGESFYSHAGFTHDPKTVFEYTRYISANKNIHKLNKIQILNAKKFMYLLSFKNSFINQDLIPRNNFIKINIKEKKIFQNYFHSDLFLEKLIPLIQNKKNIFSDLTFKNFEKILNDSKHVF